MNVDTTFAHCANAVLKHIIVPIIKGTVAICILLEKSMNSFGLQTLVQNFKGLCPCPESVFPPLALSELPFRFTSQKFDT